MSIPAGKVTLGRDTDPSKSFCWDNEGPLQVSCDAWACDAARQTVMCMIHASAAGKALLPAARGCLCANAAFLPALHLVLLPTKDSAVHCRPLTRQNLQAAQLKPV